MGPVAAIESAEIMVIDRDSANAREALAAMYALPYKEFIRMFHSNVVSNRYMRYLNNIIECPRPLSAYPVLRANRCGPIVEV